MPGSSLKRRFLWAIGALVFLVLAAGAGLVVSAATTRQGLGEVRRLEAAARRAQSIAMLAREQYIHEAHTIILGDESHVSHHDAYVAAFGEQAVTLRRELGAEGGARIDQVLEDSHQLARVFSEEIIPAVRAHDLEAVHAAHDRANALVDRMTASADALAQTLDARARAAEQRVDQLAGRLVALAALSSILAVFVASIIAGRAWRALSEPLDALRRVAESVGAGARDARVGAIAADELAVVARAFDAMLDRVAAQETELVAAERLAAIGRVAAGVAHEINNPLTVIRGYTKMLLKEALPARVVEELAIVDSEAGLCQRVAEDLLAYARTPSLARAQISVSALARDATDRFRIESTGARIDTQIEERELSLDPVRMRQVLVNLLRNAWEASPGTPIQIRGRAVGDVYVLAVDDRGPGLAVEARDRLFEPFFTTRSEGSGLGLAVCFGLVSAHGGVIVPRARDGGGLSMSIELPIEEPAR